MIAPSLEMLFRDKTTGLPLRSGTVEFFKDNERNEHKTVYKLSGSPPDYGYTPLVNNPIELTGIGTFADDTGNDIIPYFYPYDDEGNVQLYYVKVFDKDGVFQWDRQGWPNFASSGQDAADFVNYIPNGQFLAHNDIPATDTTEAGEVTEAVTILAPGGFSFEREPMSSSKDIITFMRNGSQLLTPNASPRFSLVVECEAAGGDEFKDLRIKFPDVNKFSSLTQNYTFAFAARSDNGASTNVAFYLVKNYGTGGSDPDFTNLAQFTITPSENVFQHAFIFGMNSDKTIGTLDDDYVALAIRFPNSLYRLVFDNMVLTVNDIVFSLSDLFPQTTNADFFARGIMGWMPTPKPDGSDLYLTPRLTKSGVIWDTSEVGQVVLDLVNTTAPNDTNLLLCDGSKLEYVGYSDIGIPYKRLGDKVWIDSLNVPRYGTGKDYCTALIIGGVNFLTLQNNTAGSVTATADGAVPTNFNFTTLQTGAITYGVNSFYDVTYLILENAAAGAVTVTSAGTSGFTVSTYRTGTSLLKQISLITTVSASGLAGTYFLYSSTSTNFYVWFKVDNVGADPMVGGRTGILVNLTGTDTAGDVAARIMSALNGGQVSLIKTTAGNTITAGSYFLFNTTADNFFVWYTVDGIGTKPSVADRKAIQIDILSADTNAQVATKTMIAINRKYYALPDPRGLFPRFYDASGTVDSNFRYSSTVNGLTSLSLGNVQFDGNLSHNHIATADLNPDYLGVQGAQDVEPKAPNTTKGFDVSSTMTPEVTISYDGINQTQSLNMSFAGFIRY